MAADYDATEFIDTDFQAHKSPTASAAVNAAMDPSRAPTREDVDRKVVEAQQKLAELKRAQEELERERASLEELRRRQNEFQTGRQEMIENLTRGLALLDEAEFATRRDAEQMNKAIGDFRLAMEKIQSIQEEAWTKENFPIELTRGLTIIENARMEWNTARLKIPALAGESGQNLQKEPVQQTAAPSLTDLSLGQLCKIGLAMTWPLAVAVVAVGVMIALLVRH